MRDCDRMAERLVAAAEWATRQPETAGLPVGLFGADTGGAGVLLAAARRPDLVSAVVCRGGRDRLTDEELGSVRAPALLVGSSADGSAGSWDRSALGQLPGPKDLVVFPAPFQMTRDYGTLERVAELTREWFDRHLTARPGDAAGPAGGAGCAGPG